MYSRLGRLVISLLVIASFVGQFLWGSRFSSNKIDFAGLDSPTVPCDLRYSSIPTELKNDESSVANTLQNKGVGIARPPHLAEQITIVMLTADEKRFVDLRDIVAVGSNHSLVEEVIILWNNPINISGYTMLQEKLINYTSHKLRILQSTKNSLNNRYDAGFLGIQTGAVMILDDDLTILPDTIDCVHESWLAKKNQVHSFGPSRKVYEEGYSARKGNHTQNFLLPRFLLATDYLDVYFDPIHTAIRQYVDRQEAHCDDIAFASVLTKHTGLPLVFVPAPHATRLDSGKNSFYNTLPQHAKQVKKEFTQSDGISKGKWNNRVNARDECSRGLIHMLDWVMPTVESAQCNYSRTHPKALSFKGNNFAFDAIETPTRRTVNLTQLVLPTLVTREYWYTWEQQVNESRRPLNCLHIPKTGGSSLVSLAIEHQMNWGECLFLDQFKLPGTIMRLKCPHSNEPWPMDEVFPDRRWWHTPIQYLPSRINNETDPRPNPYRGFDLFTVIRNPYDRVISEFYYRCNLQKALCKDKDHPILGPKILNKLVQTALTRFMAAEPNTADYYLDFGHWIPQSHFIQPKGRRKAKRMVKHVLHMEHLKEQFDSLASAYNLGMRLPKKRIRSRADFAGQSKLGIQHLTKSTRRLIERVYEEDFRLGGYRMLKNRSAHR